MKKIQLILFIILLGIFWQKAMGQTVFRGRITDAVTGNPLKATLAIWDDEGNETEPESQKGFVNYLGKKRWYVDGTFSITNPPEILHLEIRRGLETLPLTTIVHTSKVTREKEFRLKRWTDMTQKGYVSGDSHVHFISPETALLQMQAEDLHIVNLLTSDFTNDVELFTGALDNHSTHEHYIYVGQEIRDWQLGHANLLDLKDIVEPLEPFGGKFLSETNLNLLLSPRLEESMKQGAANVWAHFSNLPGLESAVAFPLGLIHAVELMTYDDPTRLPSHWAPWEFATLPPEQFPPMRGMDLYYQWLNAGFQVPITAGTDKMGNDIPVGSNRSYVYTGGDISYDKWIEGMKKGRGFVTNGPLLTFTVGDHQSGDSVNFNGKKMVRAKVRAESLLPFSRLEIMANGIPVAYKSLRGSRKDTTVHSAELEADIELTESTWIAARVTSYNTSGILPRGLTVFAHTNPVYFFKEGKPVYREASVNYLMSFLESGRNWIFNYSNFKNKEEKEEALMYLEKATTILKQMKKDTKRE